MNKKRIIPRLIVSPIVFALLILTYAMGCVKHFIKFIRYGGEFMTYDKDDDKRMNEIYKILKDIKEK